MVQKGQYLERMTVVQRGPVGLEALFHRGERAPPVVLCAPHPEQGGSMDSPVVAEAAWALTRAGHATLRFNYRGAGASQGTWEGGAHDLDDLAAALLHLGESADHPRVALCGYSYGAVLSAQLAAARPEVPVVALVAPPVEGYGLGEALASLAARPGGPPALLALCGSEDPFCPPGPLGRLLAPFGEAATLDVIAGADHVFSRGLSELGRLLADFFTQRRTGW